MNNFNKDLTDKSKLHLIEGEYLPNISDITPIAFHEYPSYVTKSYFYVEYDNTSSIATYEKNLIALFNNNGIKCRIDNKIVFEVNYLNRRIFIGFHDWRFSIGRSYYNEYERY